MRLWETWLFYEPILIFPLSLFFFYVEVRKDCSFRWNDEGDGPKPRVRALHTRMLLSACEFFPDKLRRVCVLRPPLALLEALGRILQRLPLVRGCSSGSGGGARGYREQGTVDASREGASARGGAFPPPGCCRRREPLCSFQQVWGACV